MMVQNGWKRIVLWAAVVSFCIPAPALLAEDPVHRGVAASQTKAAASPRPMIADVAMGPGGVATGRVVDAQGRPMADTVVSIRNANAVVARTTTDQTGAFAVRGLPGGIYQVTAGQGMRVFRLWAAQTAPPVAMKGLLIVSDPNAVLAQWEPGTFGAFLEEAKYTLTNPLVVGGIVAMAIGIPIAVHNANKEEKKSGS